MLHLTEYYNYLVAKGQYSATNLGYSYIYIFNSFWSKRYKLELGSREKQGEFCWFIDIRLMKP